MVCLATLRLRRTECTSHNESISVAWAEAFVLVVLLLYSRKDLDDPALAFADEFDEDDALDDELQKKLDDALNGLSHMPQPRKAQRPSKPQPTSFAGKCSPRPATIPVAEVVPVPIHNASARPPAITPAVTLVATAPPVSAIVTGPLHTATSPAAWIQSQLDLGLEAQCQEGPTKGYVYLEGRVAPVGRLTSFPRPHPTNISVNCQVHSGCRRVFAWKKAPRLELPGSTAPATDSCRMVQTVVF